MSPHSPGPPNVKTAVRPRDILFVTQLLLIVLSADGRLVPVRSSLFLSVCLCVSVRLSVYASLSACCCSLVSAVVKAYMLFGVVCVFVRKIVPRRASACRTSRP